MKKLPVLLGFIALLASAYALADEAELNQAPLTWKQAALSDGQELFMALCAACHGKSGMGDGPAATAMKKGVPDLTSLAARNGGEFPRKQVQAAIAGKSRVASHGTAEMPVWGRAFEEIRPDWKLHRREGFAKQRVYNLTEYLATIQVK